MKRLFKNMAFGSVKINTYLLGAFTVGTVLRSHDWMTLVFVVWMLIDCFIVFGDEDVSKLLEKKQKELQNNQESWNE